MILLDNNPLDLLHYTGIQRDPTFVAIHGLVAYVAAVTSVVIVSVYAVVRFDANSTVSQVMREEKNLPGEEAEGIPPNRARAPAANSERFADRYILDIRDQTYPRDEPHQLGFAQDIGGVVNRQTVEQIEQHDGDEEDEQHEYDVTPDGMRDERDVAGVELAGEHDDGLEDRARGIGEVRVTAVLEERVEGQGEGEDEESVREEKTREIEGHCAEHFDAGGHARMLTDQDHQLPGGQQNRHGGDLRPRAAQQGEGQRDQHNLQPIFQIRQVVPGAGEELQGLPDDEEQQQHSGEGPQNSVVIPGDSQRTAQSAEIVV